MLSYTTQFKYRCNILTCREEDGLLDMTLSDHDTGVVDGLGDAKLEHLSLKATLKQLLCGKLENTIQVPFVLVQDPEAG